MSGWRCILLPGRHDGRRAEGIEVVPVAALRASASAGADGPIVALSGEADATTATELRETLATQLGTGARLVDGGRVRAVVPGLRQPACPDPGG
jgi:hypothetical protein